jgi:glycosyltransferase 2 family protein
MNKAFTRQVIPIALAIGLLWYVLNDVPLTRLADQFRRASYGWLTVVTLLIGLYMVVRAARWQLTLQAIGFQPSLFRATVALLAGLLASLIVPGAGELTRCGTLQRTDGIPLTQGIGSVVAERIVDLLMLALMLLLTALLEFNRMRQYVAGVTLAAPSTVVVGVIVGFLVVISLLVHWVLRRPVVHDHPLWLKARSLIYGFGRGFMAIRQLPKPGLFVAMTLLSQSMAWLITYCLLLATDETRLLPPTAALTILTVSSLGGLAVPTQGGIGTYHFFVSRALVLYGFTAAGGAVVATFLHAVGFGINLLLSSLSFLILPFLLRQRARQVEKPTV